MLCTLFSNRLKKELMRVVITSAIVASLFIVLLCIDTNCNKPKRTYITTVSNSIEYANWTAKDKIVWCGYWVWIANPSQCVDIVRLESPWFGVSIYDFEY